MRIDFTKMHGAGNDFVVIDERLCPLDLDSGLIQRIADRRFGVGCDQVVRLRPATADADVLMVIHNADGSVSSTCGNATRCVAALVAGEERDEATIETLGGVLASRVLPSGDVVVDMGEPRFDAAALGIRDGVDTLHLPLAGDPAACSMGNPHVTFFVEHLASLGRGEEVSRDPFFTDGVNAGFAVVESRDRLRLRVWERGTGLTLACGSGACAAAVNAHRRGLTERRVAVLVDGGALGIEWREADGHVLMTGPVATSFTGTISW